jgi:repressor LexA
MPTDRERQVLDFVQAYTRRHGVAPKLKEIAAHLGIASRGVVHRYLRALEDEGLIAIEPEVARGVRVMRITRGRAAQTVLPVLGHIAAGLPIEAIPDETQIDLGEFFMGPNRFVLRVAGDSMIEAGILNDDMVIVESRPSARNGEIVVALIDRDEATLKYFHHPQAGQRASRPHALRRRTRGHPGCRGRADAVVPVAVDIRPVLPPLPLTLGPVAAAEHRSRRRIRPRGCAVRAGSANLPAAQGGAVWQAPASARSAGGVGGSGVCFLLVTCITPITTVA